MAKRENTPGALPIYQQVSELLTREIAAGRLLDGQRLPPERAMAAEHGVTVRTLRKALAELLPGLRAQHGLDVVVANGENSAGGNGITPDTAAEIYA
ncbi:MAG: YmdB family metallophosphoesterase, partial [Alphaproteobacteria bacterium]